MDNPTVGMQTCMWQPFTEYYNAFHRKGEQTTGKMYWNIYEISHETKGMNDHLKKGKNSGIIH